MIKKIRFITAVFVFAIFSASSNAYATNAQLVPISVGDILIFIPAATPEEPSAPNQPPEVFSNDFTYDSASPITSISIYASLVTDPDITDIDDPRRDLFTYVFSTSESYTNSNGQTQNGTITQISGERHGTFKYTPNAGFSGVDNVWFHVIDDQGATSNIAKLTFNVSSSNNSPDAVEDVIYVPVGGTITYSLVANDTDPDGDTLRISNIGPVAMPDPTLGTLSMEPDRQTIKYISNGSLGSDTFSYTVTDGTSTVAGIVKLYVVGAPKLNQSIFEFNARLKEQEQFLVMTDATVTDEAFSLDQLRIQFDENKSYADLSFQDKKNSTDGYDAHVVAYNTLDPRWINFKNFVLYMSKEDDGTNKIDNYRFRIINPAGLTSSWGDIRISMDGAFNGNHDYTPTNDTTGTVKNTAIDIRPFDNDPKTYNGQNISAIGGVEIYSQPLFGTATLIDRNTIRYTPMPSFTGADSFKYRVIGNNLTIIDSAPANITVAVGEGNSAPVANADTADIDVSATKDIYVLNNDTDADSDSLTVTALDSLPTKGTATISSDEKYIVYQAGAVAGVDSFSYTVSDGQETATATVSVTINQLIPQSPIPTNLSVVEQNGNVVMTWDTPPRGAPDRYRVYGELSHVLFEGTPTVTGTSNSYAKIAPAAGRTYCYKVSAVYEGVENEASAKACLVVGGLAFHAPANATLSKSGQQIMLGWDPVAGASQYLVELQTTASDWVPVQVNANTSRAQALTPYHKSIFELLGHIRFRVSACNDDLVCGDFTYQNLLTRDFNIASDFSSTIPNEHYAPACMYIKPTTAIGQSLTPKWCPAQTHEAGKAEKFKIYGELADVVSNLTASSYSKDPQGLFQLDRPTKDEGKKYCYKASTQDSNGAESTFSEKACSVMGYIAYQAPEEFVEVMTDYQTKSFDLMWTPVTGAHHYLFEHQYELGKWRVDSACSPTARQLNGKTYQVCTKTVSASDAIGDTESIVYRVSACNANNVCGNYARVFFNLEPTTLISLNNKYYFAMPEMFGGQRLVIENTQGSTWVAEVLTLAEWNAINPEANGSSTNLIATAKDLNRDKVRDLKIQISSTESIFFVQVANDIFEQTLGESVLFIKVELIGQ